MEGTQADYFAIGLTHSMDTLHLLEDLLKDPKFRFAAEGTGMSGYELYVDRASVAEAVGKIRKCAKVHIEGHNIEFYDRARSICDGTRYDRLLDHTKRSDPKRPSVDGITFRL